MKRGLHRQSKSARGWGKAAPRTVGQRRALAKRCGIARAFLAPNRRPGLSEFPVISKDSRTCRPDCRGLRAAFSRARQHKRPIIARRAKRRALQAGCRWAKR